MPDRTGGEILVASALTQGVTLAFGVPGESFLAVLDALHDVRERLQFVICRQMYGSVAKWATQIDRAERIPEYVAHAYRLAMSGRPGPVVLALPVDLWQVVLWQRHVRHHPHAPGTPLSGPRVGHRPRQSGLRGAGAGVWRARRGAMIVRAVRTGPYRSRRSRVTRKDRRSSACKPPPGRRGVCRRGGMQSPHGTRRCGDDGPVEIHPDRHCRTEDRRASGSADPGHRRRTLHRGFPNGCRVQFDMVGRAAVPRCCTRSTRAPAKSDAKQFKVAAKKLGLRLIGPGTCLLLQGDDMQAAVAKVLADLAGKDTMSWR